MEPVRSRQNRKVVEAARLLRARSGDRTLLQGEKLVREAITSGAVLERLFVLAGSDVTPWSDIREVVVVTEPVMQRLAPTGDAWGPVGVLRISETALRAARPVLVATDIADPGNLGTMIRSAAAFGYDVATVGGADAWSPKVLRSAAGGHFRTRVVGEPPPHDRQTLAAVVDGGHAPSSLRPEPDHALFVGSEAHGLPDEIVDGADLLVTIPMRDAESLNAAIAASILMYELAVGNSAGGSDARD